MIARMLVDLNEKVRKGHPAPANLARKLVRVGLAEEVKDELTVDQYVDRYISGEWRGGAPPKIEQFAANHAEEIEEEFQRRQVTEKPPQRPRAKK